MSEVIFSCPKCRNRMEAEAYMRGLTISCPACHAQVVVPALVKAPDFVTRSGPDPLVELVHQHHEKPAKRTPWGLIIALCVTCAALLAVTIAWLIFAHTGSPTAVKQPVTNTTQSATPALPAVTNEPGASPPVAPPVEKEVPVQATHEVPQAETRKPEPPPPISPPPVPREVQAPEARVSSLPVEAEVYCLAFCGDKIIGGAHGHIYVWNVDDLKLVRDIPCRGVNVHSLAPYKDKRRVLAAHGTRNISDATTPKICMSIWDIETGGSLLEFSAAINPITSLLISPDERHVITGEWGDASHSWDAVTGKPEWQFIGSAPEKGGWAPDGRHMIAPRRETKRFAVLDEGGKTILTWSSDEVASLDLRNGQILHMQKFKGGRRQLVRAGEQLWSWNHARYSLLNEATLQIWNNATDQQIGSFNEINDVVVLLPLADGRRGIIGGGTANGNISVQTTSGVVQGKWYGYAELWDFSEKKSLGNLGQYDSPVKVIAVSGDNRWAAIADRRQAGSRLTLFRLPPASAGAPAASTATAAIVKARASTSPVVPQAPAPPSAVRVDKPAPLVGDWLVTSAGSIGGCELIATRISDGGGGPSKVMLHITPDAIYHRFYSASIMPQAWGPATKHVKTSSGGAYVEIKYDYTCKQDQKPYPITIRWKAADGATYTREGLWKIEKNILVMAIPLDHFGEPRATDFAAPTSSSFDKSVIVATRTQPGP
jgi:hypothetical protein